MKSFFLALLVAAAPLNLLAQSIAQKTPLPPHPNAPASQQVEEEKIDAPGQTPAATPGKAPTSGYMETTQVKALMHKMWLAEFRLNDLLTQVHPEKWKISPGERKSFDQSLDSLRK